jgi:hypothetical protein
MAAMPYAVTRRNPLIGDGRPDQSDQATAQRC